MLLKLESQLAELTDSASLAGARKPRTVTEVFDGIRLQDAKLNRGLKQLLPNLAIDTPAPVYTPNPNRVRLGDPGFEEQRNADRDAIGEIGMQYGKYGRVQSWFDRLHRTT